ncbi:hypothetical protein DUI87_22218 [Hirundo rustica rustica]|uniref:Uncharacterized protein n=1 Tax=Hirundo rustica rustica TaxID=333673 RepID=A0A3M0JKB3_HIRRU|nr:hypothetical protein DUI87_22218 [Hirundo rustica rustica]
MESGQASGQIPKRGEQQAQLDVTCLSLAKGKKEKDPPTGIKGFYKGVTNFPGLYLLYLLVTLTSLKCHEFRILDVQSSTPFGFAY